MQRKPTATARRRGWRRVLRVAAAALLAFVLGSVALVGLFGLVDPPTSAFMLAHRLETGEAADQRWRDLEAVSPRLALAVVAAEDQKFPRHHGFDLDAIGSAWRSRGTDGPARGASTITQQVAKNLFLWSGRSWVRKGLEAWFTLLIETLWSKRRILEVYLNLAEFGPGIYGAEAAAQRHFGRPASALDRRQAARLAAVLPSPRNYSVARPSRYVLGRVRWIERQMGQLGDAYLGPVLEP
jgi:monofunctional biosynthetic peptidoglycan transglycosylase